MRGYLVRIGYYVSLIMQLTSAGLFICTAVVALVSAGFTCRILLPEVADGFVLLFLGLLIAGAALAIVGLSSSKPALGVRWVGLALLVLAFMILGYGANPGVGAINLSLAWWWIGLVAAITATSATYWIGCNFCRILTPFRTV